MAYEIRSKFNQLVRTSAREQPSMEVKAPQGSVLVSSPKRTRTHVTISLACTRIHAEYSAITIRNRQRDDQAAKV